MALVVIGLLRERLADGSYHVFSPNVPGFHVVEQDQENAMKEAMPILERTLAERAEEAGIGKEVKLTPAPIEINHFVPDELRQHFGKERPRNAPERIMVEIT
jgi:hypothetical protein